MRVKAGDAVWFIDEDGLATTATVLGTDGEWSRLTGLLVPRFNAHLHPTMEQALASEIRNTLKEIKLHGKAIGRSNDKLDRLAMQLYKGEDASS